MVVDGVHAVASDCRTQICVHNENTDLTVFDGATYLVHRTAISQIFGPNSSLQVLRSSDHGNHWRLLAVIPAPEGRDLRDPSFYQVDGRLAIKALTRRQVVSLRDSDVDTIAVTSVSPDGGRTWGPLAPIGPVRWSFWRIRDDARGVHYTAAYEDGDRSVQLFSSADGMHWTDVSRIYGRSEDTPLETELVFVPSGKLLALVRLDGDNAELFGNAGRLRTKVCWAGPPFASWDCSRELRGVRLDGPVAFFERGETGGSAPRGSTVGGCSWSRASTCWSRRPRKRTALYELTGDLDGGDVQRLPAAHPRAHRLARARLAPRPDPARRAPRCRRPRPGPATSTANSPPICAVASLPTASPASAARPAPTRSSSPSRGNAAASARRAPRRMADTAARLVDHVLPSAPYRQWGLSLPKPLRLRLARHPAWTTWIGGLIVRAIGAWQRRVARALHLAAPQTGAITFVQRFGGLVNLNVHFHLLVPDGVFTPTADDGLAFARLPAPTGTDLLAILDRVIPPHRAPHRRRDRRLRRRR